MDKNELLGVIQSYKDAANSIVSDKLPEIERSQSSLVEKIVGLAKEDKQKIARGYSRLIQHDFSVAEVYYKQMVKMIEDIYDDAKRLP